MEVYTVKKSRQCLLWQCLTICNIHMNMATRIPFEIYPSGLQKKCFSKDFPVDT